MTSKERLLQITKELSLDAYETLTMVENIPTIEFLTLDSLLDFAKKHNIDTVFYHYITIEAGDLMIDDDVIAKMNITKEELSVLEQAFCDYNESVCKLDFSKPIRLNVYCVYQGVIYSVEEEDCWYSEAGFSYPEIAAIEIRTNFLNEIIDAHKTTEEQLSMQRLKLKQQLLQDEEFLKCTNMNLRRAYANKLFRLNKEVQELFYRENGGWYDVSILTFIEQVWREYKANR